MVRIAINLSFCLAGLVAGLSTDDVQAGSHKLYHERQGSQIEAVFRQLPSIENEIESLFDDVSFFSSLGASPQAEPKADRDVEDLFHRLSQQQIQKKSDDRKLSFLGNSLQEAGILGGDGVRNRDSIRGSVDAVTQTAPAFSQERMADVPGPSLEGANIGKVGKDMKSFKGLGGHHKNKETKKGKRYKEEKGKVNDKLMKSTKSGKKEKNFSYDPNLAEDDTYAVYEDFDFGDWAWEFEEVEEKQPQMQKYSLETSESPFNDVSFGGLSGMISKVDVVTNGVGGLMGRAEGITDEGQYQFANAPVTLTTNKVGHYKFNFPSIQHTVYSGPVHLKAHSSIDLGPFDPEIFDIMQSILTPYLQEKMGPALNAYNLEVDYSPGHDINIDKNDIVTLMEVKVTMKVISDSIESLRYITSKQASRWIHDFFGGSELYKVLEALEDGTIPVKDIAFVNQEFKVNRNIVSEANSQNFGRSPGRNNNTENPSKSAAMIGVTLSVIAVGLLFFMHYTGRLPSKAQIGDFSLNARDSIASRMPSINDKLGKKKRGKDEYAEGGRRRRTFSGTFRRFPDGGLQKAAIQKKPAKSEQFLRDDASDASSSSGVQPSYKSSTMDDYSLSRYGVDYGPPTPSRNSSIPMTPVGLRSDDEFSMPDDYDSAHTGRSSESLLGKVGKTATYLMSPMRKDRSPPVHGSPFPSRAARRVTAADIASPDEVDNWSIRSYETDVKDNKTPSDHPMYRGWNESGPELRRPQPPLDNGENRREKLSLPFFS